MSSSPGSPQAARAHTLPGAELQAVLDALGLQTTDEFDLVEAIKACERQIAHLHAWYRHGPSRSFSTREDYAFCGACEDTEVTNQFHQHDRAAATGRETGAALTQPPTEASNHAGLAIELVEERRSTLAALDAGRITLTKARIIVHGLQWLDDPWLEAEVEDRLLDDAPELTEQQLRRRLNRILMETDPDTVSKRHANSRKNRRVCPPKPDDDVTGIASMTLVGPAEDLTALYTAVDAAARSTGGHRSYPASGHASGTTHPAHRS